MEKRKQIKLRKLAASKILSVVCALSLVTSLIPTQVTYAFGAEDSSFQVSQQNSSEPSDYYYLDTISGANWALRVSTADSGMPAAASLDDLSSWFGAANVAFSADEAADEAARAALAELYDVSDASAVAVGSFSLPGGKAMPSDAKLTAWRLSHGQSVPASSLKAWSWDGESLAPIELADDATLSGLTFDAGGASFSLEPGQTVVVADASALTEKTEDTLEAGTYTVTANLYIPGSENIVLPGVQVYMLCPTFAPTIPVSDNAKMVVDENGNKTISFALNNGPSDVFTLQDIAGAPGETEVSNVQRINEDLLYGTEVSTNTKCYGRVGSFDVKLLNDSGDYSFTACKEFPTPVSRYTTMQVRLSVDLSSARRSYVEPDNASDAVSRDFVDSVTGFSAKVTTTEASVAAALKNDGTKLVVDSSASGDAFKNAQSALTPLYNGELSFDFYNTNLVDASGNQVRLAGNTKVEIKLPTSKSDICDVALLQNGSATTLLENEKAEGGAFSITREKLGAFAIVDKTKASKWTSKTLTNGETGYSWTESYTDAASKNGSGSTPGSILSSIVRFDVSVVSDAGTLADWQKCIDAAFDEGAGKTNVTNAFGCFPRNFNLNQVVDTWWQGESLRTLSVPRTDGDGVTSDTKAFLVTVADGVTSAQLLATDVTDSSVDVAVFPITLTSDESNERLIRLFNGEGSQTNSAYDGYGKSYIVFASGVDAKQYERTFVGEDAAADVSYKVSTYKSDVAAALRQAKGSFSAYDSTADEASSIKDAFDAQLNINPTFRVFNVDIMGVDGNSVSLGSDEETELTLKSAYSSSRIYQWDGSKLTLLTQGSDDSLTVKNAALGAYVLVDANTARPKQYSFTFTDKETGIAASVSTAYKPWAEALGAEGVSLKVTKANADSDSYKQTVELLKQEYVQEVPFAIYTVELVDKSGEAINFGSGFYLSLSFPAAAESSLYSLYETDGTYSITSRSASVDENGVLQTNSVIPGSALVLADASNADKRQKYKRTFTAQVDGRDLIVDVASSEPCMEKYLKDEGAATLEVRKIDSSDAFESAMKASAYRVPEYVGYSIRLRGADGSYAEPKYVGVNGDSYTTITLSNLFGPETWSYNSALYGTSGTQQPFDLIQCASDGSVVWSGKKNGRASYDSLNVVDESDGTKTFNGQWVCRVNLGGFEDCYLIDDQWAWLQWTDVEVPAAKEFVFTGKEQSAYTISSVRYGVDSRPLVEVVSGDISATEVGEYTCTVRPTLSFARWAGSEGDDARAERTFTWKIVEAGDVSALTQPIAEAQALLDAATVSADGKDVMSNAQWVSQTDHDVLASAIADAQTMADSTKAVAKTAVEDQAAALAAAVTAFKAAQKAGLKDAGTTYSVTANLSMPGEYNPVLPGVTVYANNPNNPFADKAGNSPVLDGGSAEGVENTAPTTPLSDNATILVAPDGTKTLTIDLPNPVFTVQDLGTCEALENVKVETKEPADKSVWDYGKYDTRICRVTITLPADAVTTGVQTYTFTGSKLYAVPVNADIQPEAGKPALNLTIDYSTVKTSEAVDASVLASAVADAKKLADGATVSVDGSDVSSKSTWVTKEALAAFNDAIAKASAVANSALLSKQMVTDATEDLQTAVDAFKAAAKPGTKRMVVDRLYGQTRFDTASAISSAGFDAASTVVIASGANFPDALSASSLAGAYGAPVLLTDPNALSEQVAAEIDRLGAIRAVIVGGDGAVSQAVAASIEAKGLAVERVYGQTRFDTAIKVAEKAAEAGASSATAIVASGASYADALTASPYAYKMGAPIYLADESGALSDATIEAIKAGGYEKILIVGGDGRISADTEAVLGAVADVERFSGQTRYETAAKMAAFCVSEGMSYSGVAVASGANFPDALAGGALCGKLGSVLLLAGGSDEDSAFALNALSEHSSSIEKAFVLGGDAAISDELFEKIEGALAL